MEKNMEEVLALRMATGVSIPQAADALSKCGDSNLAKEYLKLKLSGASMYKVKPNGRRVAYCDDDYIEKAKENLIQKG